MFRHLLDSVVFILGLAVVCWIGAGYLGSNHLALLVTLLIGAGYVVGGLELLRYRRATTTLERSVAEKIVERGHFICPYSNATKGNIEVVTELA